MNCCESQFRYQINSLDDEKTFKLIGVYRNDIRDQTDQTGFTNRPRCLKRFELQKLMVGRVTVYADSKTRRRWCGESCWISGNRMSSQIPFQALTARTCVLGVEIATRTRTS